MILGGFGVGKDMITIIVASFVKEGKMDILEDGVEMVANSLFCRYLMHVNSLVEKDSQANFVSSLSGFYKTILHFVGFHRCFDKYLR